MAKETGIIKPNKFFGEGLPSYNPFPGLFSMKQIVKKLQISFGVILFSSPLFWLWDMPSLAGKIALSALYALVILFIYRKWIM